MFDRIDRGLCTVAQMQGLEDTGYMLFHGSFANDQGVGNFSVGSTFAEQSQHIEFTPGQRDLFYRKLRGGTFRRKRTDQATGDGRVELIDSRVGQPNRLGQILGRYILQQISMGTRLQ